MKFPPRQRMAHKIEAIRRSNWNMKGALKRWRESIVNSKEVLKLLLWRGIFFNFLCFLALHWKLQGLVTFRTNFRTKLLRENRLCNIIKKRIRMALIRYTVAIWGFSGSNTAVEWICLEPGSVIFTFVLPRNFLPEIIEFSLSRNHFKFFTSLQHDKKSHWVLHKVEAPCGTKYSISSVGREWKRENFVNNSNEFIWNQA